MTKNTKQTTSNNIQQNAKIDDFDGLTIEVIESEQVADKKVVKKGVYIIPNSFTLLSLLAGFYAIIISSQGQFFQACVAIFVSAILDGMDGRTARMLNAQSAFGEQLDSLADCIAFGLTPAVLIYHYALQPLGRFGIACAFIYASCAALRLARFNVQIGVVDKKYFIGVASPLAAILIATFVMVTMDYPSILPRDGRALQILSAVWAVVAGLLMVSNLKYHSFKEFDKKRVPFVMLIVVILVLGIVLYDIPMGLLGISVVYALSGIVTGIWQKLKAK